MISNKLTLAAALTAAFMTTLPLAVQAQSAKSAKDFVQSFYTWYIPQMTKNVPVPSNERILKERAKIGRAHV